MSYLHNIFKRVKPGIFLHVQPLRPIQKAFKLNVTTSGARTDLQNNLLVALRYTNPVVQMKVLISELHLNVLLFIYQFFPQHMNLTIMLTKKIQFTCHCLISKFKHGFLDPNQLKCIMIIGLNEYLNELWLRYLNELWFMFSKLVCTST